MKLAIKDLYTSLRIDEIEDIDRLVPGAPRAQILRALLRYGLKDKVGFQAWLRTTSNPPGDL